jgi:Subtilase family
VFTTDFVETMKTDIIDSKHSMFYKRYWFFSTMKNALSTHLCLFIFVFLMETKGIRAVKNHAPPNEYDTMNTDDVFKNSPRRLALEDIPNIAGLINYLSKESIDPKLGAKLTALLDTSKLSRTDMNDPIVLDIAFTSPIDNDLASAMFASVNGVDVINCMGVTCSVRAEIRNLEEIAAFDQVKFLRQPRFMTDKGKVTSEGVKAMYADTASEKYSVTGAGILIGVMSDSYNCLGGAATDISTGDLPRDSTIVSDLTPSECLTEDGSDEGRAMMQLVHDVAPGARLAFRTAFRGEADFAAGILALADIGCDIIVDDIQLLEEPIFQDGIITQAVDRVAAQGVAFFSSAGNRARTSWEEPKGFLPVNASGILFHQFGSNSQGNPIIFQRIAMRRDTANRIFVLQWDEPLFSASGANGSRSDVDIFLYYNGTIVGAGEDDNIGMNPIETIDFSPSAILSNNATVFVDMAIVSFSGPLPKYMKVLVFGEAKFEFYNGSSTSFGHKIAAMGAGVGAASYLRTPAFGVSPPLIEAFSSAGGSPILFDKNGTRLLSKDVRKQPRFTGPDGGVTTFFGDNNRFFGTSASAPHVAAVAALMLQAKGGPKSLAPQQIFAILQNTTIDMDDPFTSGFDVGFDFRTGYGLINAAAALDSMMIKAPTKCGLFGWSLFCPFTFCGFFGRLLGLCRSK